MKKMVKCWVVYDLNRKGYEADDGGCYQSIIDAYIFRDEQIAKESKDAYNMWMLTIDFPKIEKYCPPDWDFEVAELEAHQLSGPRIVKEIELHYDDGEENA